MKRKVLLFLSAHRFQAQLWQNGVLTQEQVFPDTNEGRGEFATFLQNHREPALLLTDVIEEDFRHEVVPHLHGKNRNDQQQRKFEQFYRNTPFRQAVLHERQKEGRRDDLMLYSALTNPQAITSWLETMRQQHSPLAGIYSVPSISKPLIENIQAEHVLLLTWEKGTGLRQTYFNAKRLYLSRLSPVNNGNSFSDVVAAETSRTQQYLRSLSLLPLGQTLQVHIVCHPEDQHHLEQKLQNADGMSYSYVDIQELGRRIKSKNTYDDSDATTLFLHLLASRPPTSHYAPAEHTHYYGLRQLRLRLYWLSALTITASLLWGTLSMWEGYALNEENNELARQSQQLAQRTQQITRNFPHQLASPADMKSAVTTIRALGSYPSSPQTIWAGLSASLDSFPRIRIDRLTWQTSAAGNAPAGGAGTELQGAGMVISGELEGWNGDYRGALAYLDQFQQALKQRNYTVTPMTLPLDVSSKASIADSTSSEKEKPALFSLKITWSQP